MQFLYIHTDKKLAVGGNRVLKMRVRNCPGLVTIYIFWG